MHGQAAHRRHRAWLVRRDPLRDHRRHSQPGTCRTVHAHAGPAGGAGREVRREEDLSPTTATCSPTRTSTRFRSCTMWDQHTEPGDCGAGGRQARLPRKADGLHGRRLQQDHGGGEERRRASCRSATSAASIRATAWPSRRSTTGRIGKIVALQLAPQHSRRLDADDPRTRSAPSSAMPSTTPTSCCGSPATRVASAYAQTVERAQPQVSRHRPDHVPLQGRRHGDAGDRVVHAGEDALRHRRAHVDHRHRRHHPCAGHLPQSRHRRRRQAAQPGHDLLADVRRRARRRVARGVRLFRQLRAEGHDAGDRPAGRCRGRTRGDARGGGIGAHRQGGSGSDRRHENGRDETAGSGRRPRQHGHEPCAGLYAHSRTSRWWACASAASPSASCPKR